MATIYFIKGLDQSEKVCYNESKEYILDNHKTLIEDFIDNKFKCKTNTVTKSKKEAATDKSFMDGYYLFPNLSLFEKSTSIKRGYIYNSYDPCFIKLGKFVIIDNDKKDKKDKQDKKDETDKNENKDNDDEKEEAIVFQESPIYQKREETLECIQDTIDKLGKIRQDLYPQDLNEETQVEFTEEIIAEKIKEFIVTFNLTNGKENMKRKLSILQELFEFLKNNKYIFQRKKYRRFANTCYSKCFELQEEINRDYPEYKHIFNPIDYISIFDNGQTVSVDDIIKLFVNNSYFINCTKFNLSRSQHSIGIENKLLLVKEMTDYLYCQPFSAIIINNPKFALKLYNALVILSQQMELENNKLIEIFDPRRCIENLFH